MLVRKAVDSASSCPMGAATGLPPGYRQRGAAMAATKYLGNDLIVSVDEDDAHLLELVWRPLRRGKTVYAVRTVFLEPHGKRSIESLHRLVCQADDSQDVDHIDGNGLNCQRANLRQATRQQNNANRRRWTHASPTGFRGVYRCQGRTTYRAQISLYDKTIHLGYGRDLEHLARLYDMAALEHFGEFAVLNFPIVQERGAA